MMLELLQAPVFLVLIIIIFILVAAIAVGSYLHVHKPKFNPVFKKLSDGSVQMECTGFAGIQTTRTKLYYEKYKPGMELMYQGQKYKIVEFKEVSDPGLLKQELKIVAYLEKCD